MPEKTMAGDDGGTGSGGDNGGSSDNPVPGDTFGPRDSMSGSGDGASGSSTNPFIGEGVVTGPEGGGWIATAADGNSQVEEYFGTDHKWHIRVVKPKPKLTS